MPHLTPQGNSHMCAFHTSQGSRCVLAEEELGTQGEALMEKHLGRATVTFFSHAFSTGLNF